MKTNKDIIKSLINETPIKSVLQVNNEMMMIDLITKLGYRDEVAWEDNAEDNKKLSIICNFAERLADIQFREFEDLLKINNVNN